MLLMPDPNTANIDPFFEETTLILTCDVIEPADGKAYDRDRAPSPSAPKPT
jgi:glutamine synthetase